MPEATRVPAPAEAVVTFADAIRLAMTDAMSEDPSVICVGLGVTDPGAVFGTTRGLLERFGPGRVFDGPTSENAMTGVCVGAAVGGMRPVLSHQRFDFALLAMDQLVNSAAKWRYMFGGAFEVPLTIRLIVGRGWGQGPTHSQNLQAWLAHVPGLRVIAPSLPRDAYGLLRASIADPNPTVIIEHRWLHATRGPLDEDELTRDLSRARLCRTGDDATICASGLMTLEAIRAADWLAACGIDCDIVDLRTLNPVDWPTVLSSVGRTGRLVAVDAATVTGSVASEIVARVAVELHGRLVAAPIRLAHPDHPEPTSHGLTRDYHVTAADIARAVLEAVGRTDRVPTELGSQTPHDVPGPWFAGPF